MADGVDGTSAVTDGRWGDEDSGLVEDVKDTEANEVTLAAPEIEFWFVSEYKAEYNAEYN